MLYHLLNQKEFKVSLFKNNMKTLLAINPTKSMHMYARKHRKENSYQLWSHDNQKQPKCPPVWRLNELRYILTNGMLTGSDKDELKLHTQQEKGWL